MKKIFMIASLLATLSAESKVLRCQIIGQDIYKRVAKYNCYDAETIFRLNLQERTFIYSSQYVISAGKFCGWPPGGAYVEGQLEFLDDHRFRIVSRDMVGELQLQSNILKYTGVYNTFEMSCEFLEQGNQE